MLNGKPQNVAINCISKRLGGNTNR